MIYKSGIVCLLWIYSETSEDVNVFVFFDNVFVFNKNDVLSHSDSS